MKNKIILHHTGGRYEQVFDHYHISIKGDGEVVEMHSLSESPPHCWKRNTESIGISLCCAYEAGITSEGKVNWGKYPPTEIQLDGMAYWVAKIGIENDISEIYTHGEIADIDGYGLYDNDPDIRWDLHGLGNDIRQRAKNYAKKWQADWWVAKVLMFEKTL